MKGSLLLSSGCQYVRLLFFCAFSTSSMPSSSAYVPLLDFKVPMGILCTFFSLREWARCTVKPLSSASHWESWVITAIQYSISSLTHCIRSYMGIFALLLLLFETRVPTTTPHIRRLFGFMFSFSGRTMFILFVGLICFGLVDSCPTQPPLDAQCAWSYAMGFVTIINAFINCYILCEWARNCNANSLFKI